MQTESKVVLCGESEWQRDWIIGGEMSSCRTVEPKSWEWEICKCNSWREEHEEEEGGGEGGEEEGGEEEGEGEGGKSCDTSAIKRTRNVSNGRCESTPKTVVDVTVSQNADGHLSGRSSFVIIFFFFLFLLLLLFFVYIFLCCCCCC